MIPRYHDTRPYAYVQYKGTDLCADINCECGHLTHIDGFFCYDVECEKCGVVYIMPERLKLERKED